MNHHELRRLAEDIVEELIKRGSADYMVLVRRLEHIEATGDAQFAQLARLEPAAAEFFQAQAREIQEIKALLLRLTGGKVTMTGGGITFEQLTPNQETHMIVVKDTQESAKYLITPPTVTDARGRPVPNAQLTYEVASTSDQPGGTGKIGITPDPTNPLAGVAGPFDDNDDGSPSQVSVVVSVKLADGTLVGSFGEQFTITAGDPASIKGGGIAFEGLTPSA